MPANGPETIPPVTKHLVSSVEERMWTLAHTKDRPNEYKCAIRAAGKSSSSFILGASELIFFVITCVHEAYAITSEFV